MDPPTPERSACAAIYVIGGMAADLRVLRSTCRSLDLNAEVISCDGGVPLDRLTGAAPPGVLVFFLSPHVEHIQLLRRIRTESALHHVPLLCVLSDLAPRVDPGLADRWVPTPENIGGYEAIVRGVRRLLYGGDPRA